MQVILMRSCKLVIFRCYRHTSKQTPFTERVRRRKKRRNLHRGGALHSTASQVLINKQTETTFKNGTLFLTKQFRAGPVLRGRFCQQICLGMDSIIVVFVASKVAN